MFCLILAAFLCARERVRFWTIWWRIWAITRGLLCGLRATDDAGEAADNRNVSLARAQAVVQYLSGVLGPKYHWVAIGYGESRPSVDNSSDTNRQRNRRIEVAISR